MNSELIYTIGSVFLISLISLSGLITLMLRKDFLHRITIFLVSLAAGTLIGDAFLHIIPEAYEHNENVEEVGKLIILGILIFFILEKLIHWRHCHLETNQNHIHPVAVTNLIGDGLHNFIDGLIIGASYLAGTEIGIATTIAVFLHEVPQEIGDFGILIHAGYSKKKALLFNFFSALLAIVGGVLIVLIGKEYSEITEYLLPITAGGFIYIAVADLIPEIKHEDNNIKSILQVLIVMIGIALMFLLTLVEVHTEEDDHVADALEIQIEDEH